jgi:hypothetical protein
MARAPRFRHHVLFTRPCARSMLGLVRLRCPSREPVASGRSSLRCPGWPATAFWSPVETLLKHEGGAVRPHHHSAPGPVPPEPPDTPDAPDAPNAPNAPQSGSALEAARAGTPPETEAPHDASPSTPRRPVTSNLQRSATSLELADPRCPRSGRDAPPGLLEMLVDASSTRGGRRHPHRQGSPRK